MPDTHWALSSLSFRADEHLNKALVAEVALVGQFVEHCLNGRVLVPTLRQFALEFGA